jgi:hypothetical protein
MRLGVLDQSPIPAGSITHDHEARARSYELLVGAFDREGVQVR